MAQISAVQMEFLSTQAREQYLDGLVAALAARAGSAALPPAPPGLTQAQHLRELARTLVQRAADLGLTAEGDVTPFCLLVIDRDPAFRSSGIYQWLTAVLQSTEHSGRQRMDAVYGLLPDAVRKRVFPEAGARA